MLSVIESVVGTLSDERRKDFERELFSEIREGMVIGVLIAHDPFGVGYNIQKLYDAYSKVSTKLAAIYTDPRYDLEEEPYRPWVTCGENPRPEHERNTVKIRAQDVAFRAVFAEFDIKSRVIIDHLMRVMDH